MGSLAHDMNNPIAIIDVAYRMLRLQSAQRDAEAQLKFVDYIEEARQRLELVIDKIESVNDKGSSGITTAHFEEWTKSLEMTSKSERPL